jgi:hypothetical protein
MEPNKRPVQFTISDALREAMMLTPGQITQGLRVAAGMVLANKFGFGEPRQVGAGAHRPYVYTSTQEMRSAPKVARGVPLLQTVSEARVSRAGVNNEGLSETGT